MCLCCLPVAVRCCVLLVGCWLLFVIAVVVVCRCCLSVRVVVCCRVGVVGVAIVVSDWCPLVYVVV